MRGYRNYKSYVESGLEWLGTVPSHWRLIKNKYIFSEKKDTVGENSGEYILLSLTLQGIIPRDMDNPSGKFPAEFNTYKTVYPDDIVFCLFDIEETPRTVGHSSHSGMITGAYTVIECNDMVLSRYIYYYYLYLDIDKRLGSLYTGLRKVITRSNFFNLKTPLPPLSEQSAIADFLDAKTDQIDTLIDKKQRQIKLLQEQRTALINQAVTKGLNLNVVMKDSRIEWLGEIPEHWEVKQLRRYKVLVQTGPFGSQLHANEYVTNGFPVVNPANMVNGKIVPDKHKQIGDEKRQELSRHILQKDDVVFARRGDLGRAVLVTQHEEGWLCGTGSILIRFLESRLYSDFLSHYLQLPSLRDYFVSSSVGSTMDNLNSQILLGMPMIEPPKDEQIKITEYVGILQDKSNQVVSEISREIDLLSEYRTAIISEAVTGKIDVRGIN